MKCSICIPTYKRPSALNNLLSTIIGMHDSRVEEVLIGISYKKEDSIDTTTEHLLRMLEILKIKYTITSDLEGLLDAKQWFKDKATSDILLVVDDDAIISKDYLDLLNNFENKNVGAVSGSLQTPLDINYYKDYAYDKVDNPPEDMICNKVKVNDNGLVIIEDKWQVYMLKEHKKYECECLVGTAMFIRKELLTVDKNYNKGACNYEEFDYTYSAYKQGYKLIFDSSRVAFHLHENKGGMREKKEKLKELNSDYFKEKFKL